MEIQNWWKFTNTDGYYDIFEMANPRLTQMALSTGATLLQSDFGGFLGISIEELEQEFFKVGAIKIVDNPGTGNYSKRIHKAYSWENGLVAIYQDDPDESYTSIKLSTLNKDLFKNLSTFFASKFTSRVSSGRVYTVKATPKGMEIVSMGKANFPLERNNYENLVLKEFDHVISEFGTIDPCGRLVVINGQPGTGKTYFMRGLLSSVPEALFITVPPNLIASFGSPTFIPTLLNIKKTNTKEINPIIILVEDADEILVPRHETGMDNISACLNLSDGLMGHIFDIRIVATTNAIKANMDQAILRPGRLCRRIDIGTLSFGKAAEVFKRLTGKELTVKEQKYSLAEVYSLARNSGWTPPKVNGKMGFIKESDHLSYPEIDLI